jgi:peptidoglycan hydrolase CwlO-like protein
MDYLDQRIMRLEQQIRSKQAELGTVVAQLSSRRSMLENEQRALSQSQCDWDYNKRLQQQGQNMSSAFEAGVAKQRAVAESLMQYSTVKAAMAVARRSGELSNGAEYKGTQQRISWALQDIADKLRKLANDIQAHQRACDSLKREIADLEGHRADLQSRVIPQLQAELRRLRRQRLMAGEA